MVAQEEVIDHTVDKTPPPPDDRPMEGDSGRVVAPVKPGRQVSTERLYDSPPPPPMARASNGPFVNWLTESRQFLVGTATSVN